jgi:hypothetical protein
VKSTLKGRSFCNVTDVIKNATKELKRLSQNSFHEHFQHLYSTWQKFMFSQGDYFERNVASVSVLICISQKYNDSGNILKLPRQNEPFTNIPFSEADNTSVTLVLVTF